MIAQETEQHLLAESDVAHALEKQWGVRLAKLSRAYSVDYMIVDRQDNNLGFVEVKCRSHKYGAFPDYIISLAKLMHGIRLSQATGTPFTLIISFLDGVYYVDINEDRLRSWKVKWQGKGITRRECPNDVEPIVHIHNQWIFPVEILDYLEYFDRYVEEQTCR